MRALETAFNAVWWVVGLAVCANAYRLGILGPSGPDSGFFPLLAGLAILGGATLLFLSPKERLADGETFLPEGGSAARVLTVIALMTAMIAALPWLGFCLIGIVGMPLLLRAIGRPSWLFAVVFGAASTLAVFLVFDRILAMSLPRGPFGF